MDLKCEKCGSTKIWAVGGSGIFCAMCAPESLRPRLADFLAPGVYTLEQEVKNPQPDRRARYDWRLEPTIPAGTRFIVFDYCGYPTLLRIGVRWSHLHSVGDGHPLCRPILAALSPQTTPDDLLAWRERHDAHHYAWELLDVLLEEGKVTLDDLTAAFIKAQEEVR